MLPTGGMHMADMDKMAKDRLGPLLARVGLGLVVVYHAYGRITHGGGSAWHFSMPPTAQLLYCWAELFAGLFVILGMHCRIACGVLILLTGLSIWLDYSANPLAQPKSRLEAPWLFYCLLLTVLLVGAGEWALTIGMARGKSKPRPPSQSGIRAA